MVKEVMAMGIPRVLASMVAGVHEATIARWQVREQDGRELVLPRGKKRPVVDEAIGSRGEELVRATRGLIGVECLRHSVAGLSRRQAAAIQRATRTELERERRQRAERVWITEPGVLRGFDAMHILLPRWRDYLLVAADGCIPYRTGWALEACYNGSSVAEMLERDLHQNGIPLVMRMDRARQHHTPAVRELLEAYQVLVLHGPPHQAQYYGQLERQNREHRAWLKTLQLEEPDELDEDVEVMMSVLNGTYRRSTLGWKTAAELWQQRRVIDVDRAALREEVNEKAERIRRQLTDGDGSEGLAERLAIEQTLEQRGLLRRKKGGWC
jgi:hypothetical protein